MSNRIDSLKSLSAVVLDFNGKFTEPAVFLGIEGEGDDRRAKFAQPTEHTESGYYTWDAYRYNGKWAYGTSAERLSLVSSYPLEGWVGR